MWSLNERCVFGWHVSDSCNWRLVYGWMTISSPFLFVGVLLLLSCLCFFCVCVFSKDGMATHTVNSPGCRSVAWEATAAWRTQWHCAWSPEWRKWVIAAVPDAPNWGRVQPLIVLASVMAGVAGTPSSTAGVAPRPRAAFSSGAHWRPDCLQQWTRSGRAGGSILDTL